MDDWKPTKDLQELLIEGEIEQAIELLKNQLSAHEHAFGWYNLGVLYKRRDDHLAALDAFEKASKLAPEEAEIWNEIGLVYDEMGRLSAAETYYKKAIDLDPSFSKAWNNWGVCAFLKEDYPEAKKRFEKACALDPESTSAWFNLRDTLGELNDPAGVKRAQDRLDALGAVEEE